jgi:hypothetical protein
MGYTHYWTFKQPKRGAAAKTEAAYQLAIKACQTLIRGYNAELKQLNAAHEARLSGFTAHTKIGQYGGLKFNGTGELSHEDFSAREHFKQNLESRPYSVQDGFNFCKTARKPYDKVVVACLIVLKHYLGAQIEVSSDGESSDWVAGLQLAQRLLKLKRLKVPDTITKSDSEPCEVCGRAA